MRGPIANMSCWDADTIRTFPGVLRAQVIFTLFFIRSIFAIGHPITPLVWFNTLEIFAHPKPIKASPVGTTIFIRSIFAVRVCPGVMLLIITHMVFWNALFIIGTFHPAFRTLVQFTVLFICSTNFPHAVTIADFLHSNTYTFNKKEIYFLKNLLAMFINLHFLSALLFA